VIPNGLSEQIPSRYFPGTVLRRNLIRLRTFTDAWRAKKHEPHAALSVSSA
jgi:hypothetical protein